MSLCNCGEPTRYSHKDGDSCNKYFVSPTYEQLRKEHVHYRKLSQIYLDTLTLIRDTNACDYEYRGWANNAIELGESWK